MFYGLLQGSALPATREHCGGGKMPGGMGACRPTAYRIVTCRAGCPHPAAGAVPYSTNSISVYSVLPLKKASGSMVAYRVM